MSLASTRQRALGLVKVPHLWVVFDVSRVKRDRLEIQLAIQVHSRHNIPMSARKPSVSTRNRASKAASSHLKWKTFPFQFSPDLAPSALTRRVSRAFFASDSTYCNTGTIPLGCTLRSTASSSASTIALKSSSLRSSPSVSMSVSPSTETRPRVSSAASARARVSHASLSLGSRLGGTGSGSLDARRGVRAARSTRPFKRDVERARANGGYVYSVGTRIVNENQGCVCI